MKINDVLQADHRTITCWRLLTAFGLTLLATPLASFAQQQGKIWRVGFLALRHVDFADSDYYYGPFRHGMRELGYVEGKNLVIEWRSADGKSERLPVLAAELVQLKVDVIVTAGPQPTSAAQKATTTIPIVFGTTGDPIGSGFIKSLARPEGNITGLSNLAVELSPKLLEMLLSMVPKLSRVAILFHPLNSGDRIILTTVQAIAQRVSIKVLPVEVRTAQEIESAFSKIAHENAEAVIVGLDSLLTQQRHQIAELAAQYRLPSISAFREHVEAGALMSYGANLANSIRRAATYVDKIFKGAKPADLPVEQPIKFDFVINLKTAQALRLTIPPTLLFQADEVLR